MPIAAAVGGVLVPPLLYLAINVSADDGATKGWAIPTATVMTVLVAATYAQVMAVPAAVGSLQALAGNPAIRTLFGAPVGLDTAGGFTVWWVGTVIAVLLSAWSILAVTRITRGEEDAGRWDLLLSGRLPVRAALIRHVAAVMAVAAATATAITVALLLAGTDPAGALLHGAGTGLLGMFFVAVAALTAQVFPARAPATGTAVTVLGTGLLARMIGDGVTALGSAPRGVWNVLPIVLLSLGAAVFAVGWVPRWAGLFGGLPGVGGFLLLVVAESIAAPHWVRDISPFAHLAPVPPTSPDLTASAVMLAAAAALIAVGVGGYRRRDLRP